MTEDFRTDEPRFSHRLAVALRFLDAFTSQPIAGALSVSIPALGLEAVDVAYDWTHRFLLPPDLVLPVTVDVEVTSPDDEYVNFEPIQIDLPRPQVPPPPPVLRSAYLVEKTLWPTRALRTPPGETAVIGRIVSGGLNAVDDLKVVIWPQGQPIPAAPYTRSDAAGELLFRLPGLKGQAGGPAPVLTADMSVEISSPAGPPFPAVPATITVNLGQVQVQTFTIP